jgi:hypothetical protein
MSWYRTGTVAVTNGSKTVTGVGTLWATAVNAGDAFALVDANLNPTGAWYEVESVTNNTTLVLKQSYAGTTGSNKTYCVFNLVGNMTTPSFAQRLATFFASFQSLIDKPTTTPTASSIPIADANGDIDSGWIKDATASVKGVVELATTAETTAGQDATRAVTPAGFLAGLRGNILGTVSRSGGVPTGAVIERGSNANGSYVKFADGTMIVWGSASWVDETSDPHITATLAATFTNDYVHVRTSIKRAGATSIVLIAGNGQASEVQLTCFQITGTAGPVLRNSSFPMEYTVFGRWF